MLLNLRNRWLLGFRLCVSSSEGAAVIRLAGYPFPRVQEPTVLEALEEERVVAEKEEAVGQAQVVARFATMLAKLGSVAAFRGGAHT